MRLATYDLLIGTAIIAVFSAVVVDWMNSPLRIIFWIIMSMLFYAFITSLLYGYLKLRPMMLPLCPKCRDWNKYYRTTFSDWPIERVQCATCGQMVTVVSKKNAILDPDQDSVVFLLQWPRSLSLRWKRLR